ncbi:MAG: DUF2291 family protein [Acidobacteria bacterium]|nr:DUF2291 family protein [Acidobacteriota bacterium]
MSRTVAQRAARIGLAVAFVAAVLALLRPWTVVPIQTIPAQAFDADAYVKSIWSSRVLPSAERSAIDLQVFVQRQAGAAAAGGQARRAVFVKGVASVAQIDRTSRIGLARLRLAWAQDARTAAIQIGPVLRGTALRDALDFVRFTDFVNQLEFAGVANALNQRVLAEVLGAVNVDDLAGREVAFVGAMPASDDAPIEIVPVALRVSGGAR